MEINKIKKAAEIAKGKTTDKRWIAAIDKAVKGMESGWIVTYKTHGIMVTTENGTYRDLRRDVYVTSHDGEKKRRQPYVSHLSAEAFRQLKKVNKGAALDRAIAQWIREHDKEDL